MVFLAIAFLPGILAGLSRYFYGLGMLSFPAAVVVHGVGEMNTSRATRCGTGYFNGTNWVFYGTAGCFGVILVALLRFHRARLQKDELGTGLTPLNSA